MSDVQDPPASPASVKTPGAFRTIGEVSKDLGVPQHVLRFWETRFPQLRPLQRAGNRRYYRADDVALARRIHHLLNEAGYTIRGVQKLLADEGKASATPAPAEPPAPDTPEPAGLPFDAETRAALQTIRDLLADGLATASR